MREFEKDKIVDSDKEEDVFGRRAEDSEMDVDVDADASSTATRPDGGDSFFSSSSSSSSLPLRVTVHPIVLLSVVDHYNRVARDTKKRVVGFLLGSRIAETIDVTSCYAVPFDEDERNPDIWFLDHDYHETMRNMLRRVNASERVVGWYSSGPKMKTADLDIHRLCMRYAEHPVFVVVDVNIRRSEQGLPIECYVAEESIQNEGEEPQLSFKHISSQIGAQEVEEIGVEHLLRDVKDTNISTLTNRVQEKVASLSGLVDKLREIHTYLSHVLEKRIPMNYHIIYQIQDILNLLPNLSSQELSNAMSASTNDMNLIVYVSSLVRSIIALHKLVNNKISLKEKEKEVLHGKKDSKAVAAEKKESKDENQKTSSSK